MHIWVLGSSFEESDVKQTLITMRKVLNILDVLVSPLFINLTRLELAELHSMRRLEYLVSELNRWLAQIPGPASNPEKQKRTARN